MMNPKKMGKMMKQAQQMQKQMDVVQQKLSELDVTGVAGDGLIKVVMNGKQKLVDTAGRIEKYQKKYKKTSK